MTPEERAGKIVYYLYLELPESIVVDVRTKIMEAIGQAVEAERAACAKVADECEVAWSMGLKTTISTAIRDRGKS